MHESRLLKRPFLVAQISDLHLEAGQRLTYGVVDTLGALRRAVDHLNASHPRPDIVVVSGDLVDFGRADEYAVLHPELARLHMPCYLVPGNHDTRGPLLDAFRDHAYLPLSAEQPLDWVAEASELAKTKPDAVVMQIGGNDLNPLMVDGHFSPVGSDNWKAEYARRVGSIVNAFEDAGTKVFWVGLPYPARTDLQDPYHTINGIIAQQLGSGPVKYYDIWDTFLVDGKYSSYGMDLKNNKVLIRAEDGVHFTAAGYTREANLIVQDLATNFAISGADCAH